MSKGLDKFDVKTVRDLANVVSKNELTELEYHLENASIIIKKTSNTTQVVSSAPSYVPAPEPAVVSSPEKPVAEKEELSIDLKNAIKSPMVGTAYLSPDPDSANFISVGDKVKVGDSLLLLEAMKVFNTITSTKSGTVVSILVEDGSPVEFEQPLVIIE